LFPKAYGPLLNHVLAVFSNGLSPKQLQQNLREVGYAAAQDFLEQLEGKSRSQRIEFALTVLESLGGNAVVEESEGKQFIRGNGCPLSAVTAHHPDACLMVEALLSKIINRPVKERCRHGEAPSCFFEIA
jgi:predicted ArsR family transcriptional regulator